MLGRMSGRGSVVGWPGAAADVLVCVRACISVVLGATPSSRYERGSTQLRKAAPRPESGAQQACPPRGSPPRTTTRPAVPWFGQRVALSATLHSSIWLIATAAALWQTKRRAPPAPNASPPRRSVGLASPLHPLGAPGVACGAGGPLGGAHTPHTWSTLSLLGQ